jgi:hypothetical protein
VQQKLEHSQTPYVLVIECNPPARMLRD